MTEELVLLNFKLLPRHYPDGLHEKDPPGQRVKRPRLDPGTLQIQVRRITILTNILGIFNPELFPRS